MIEIAFAAMKRANRLNILAVSLVNQEFDPDLEERLLTAISNPAEDLVFSKNAIKVLERHPSPQVIQAFILLSLSLQV